ncbi:hypothetical protein MRX96_017174 [Rhipicephalus microplus]
MSWCRVRAVQLFRASRHPCLFAFSFLAPVTPQTRRTERREDVSARCFEEEEERPTLWSHRSGECRERHSRHGGRPVAMLQEQKIAGDVSALPDRKERRREGSRAQEEHLPIF